MTYVYTLHDAEGGPTEQFDSLAEAVLNAKHRAGPEVVFVDLPFGDSDWYGWASQDEMDDDEDNSNAMFHIIRTTVGEVTSNA